MLEELEPLFQRRTLRGLSNIHKYIAEKASNYHHDNATTMCNNNAPIYTRSFSARNSSSFKCEEVTANNQQHQNRKLTCNTGSNLHVRHRLNTSRAGTFSSSRSFRCVFRSRWRRSWSLPFKEEHTKRVQTYSDLSPRKHRTITTITQLQCATTMPLFIH